jgi:predicted SAM-dependent methyltransferase
MGLVMHVSDLPEIASNYLARAEPKKLQVGCGANLLSGWLNSDTRPLTAAVMFLDATKRFPFEDDTFDYVFSEHMIEHVSFRDGMFMLGECFRILKPGGRIRISTPDIDFLMRLYARPGDELHRAYVKWATQRFIRDAPLDHPVFVINNFFRDWGHRFIYSKDIMAAALTSLGFLTPEFLPISGSRDPHLAGLENPRRMPPGFLQLETLSVEGRKPAGDALRSEAARSESVPT